MTDALMLPVWPPATYVKFFASAAAFYNEWLALGVSIPFAIAMTTQAEFECAFNLAANGDKGEAWNAYQWHWTPRGANILAATGIDVRSERSIHRVVAAAWWELNGPLHKARDAIAACDNARSAAIAACALFEGAGAPNAAARRGLGAERWAGWIARNQSFVKARPAQG